MKTVRIYTLSNPMTNEIRYVGKTINTLEYRLGGHIREARRRNNTGHKNNWVKSLLKNGLEPKIDLLDEIEYEENWEWLEQYWISQMKSWGFNLTNMTDGGDGNKNQIFSEKSHKKRSETIKRRVLSGEIDYTERAKKISVARKGIKLSDITKEKLRQINLGKKYGLETILKKSKGGVLQLDLNGNVLNEYLTLTEAADKTGFLKGGISYACLGKLKTYKKFKWQYKNKDIVES